MTANPGELEIRQLPEPSDRDGREVLAKINLVLIALIRVFSEENDATPQQEQKLTDKTETTDKT